MPATITTTNTLGIGYQTGLFTGPVDTPLTQSWFDTVFASRLNPNPIYKQAYHCNLVDDCGGIIDWLDEYTGYETDCYPAYTLLETYGQYQLIKVGTTVTVAAGGATTQVHLDDNSHFVNGTYILPRVGNRVVLTPKGILAEVMNVNLASAGDSIIGLKLVDPLATAQIITAGDELFVLSGSYLDDCECPTGQFAFNDTPIEFDVEMIDLADKGELCGDALFKCQWLKLPFHDECGNEVDGAWYNEAIADMYRRFEKSVRYEKLLNHNWGIIPVIRARGLKWNPASTTEITTDDVRSWKLELDKAGIKCREYAVFAGRNKFSQWQRMLLAAGVVQLDSSQQPLTGCKWINMEYCGIKVEGLTLHIYDECNFSNGKLLGSGTSVFPDSAIIVPMCKRPACTRSTGRQDAGGGDNKMATTVFFRENRPGGRVWDKITDSNGILNGEGGRNTFGTGCKNHEWSVESRFLQEIHCANQWGYMGL